MTVLDRWRRLPLAGRVLTAAFAALVLVELAGALVAPLGGSEPGAGSSSAHSTRPQGLAAYRELLERSGHRVRLEDGGLAGALGADTTLVVAGAPLTADEARVVSAFVHDGGRLVAAGSQVEGALRRIVDADLDWSQGDPGPAGVVAALPETQGVGRVVGAEAVWRATGPALPVLEGPVAAVAVVGRGRVVLLADPSPLHNEHLGEADNAAFGLAIVGGSSRPVVFAEAAHGAGRATGVAAIPTRWKWALVAAGVAALVAMWSAGRRHGPPEEEGRELAPPRRAYVDALAVTLAKSGQPAAALAPLREAARNRVIRRAALAPDAGEAEVRRAAAGLGLAPDEVDALSGALRGDEDAMALARAMARSGGTGW